MRLVWVLLLSALFVGCVADHNVPTHVVSGGGPGPVGSDKPTGTVANFNGTWSGTGSSTYQNQKVDDLDFQLALTQTSNSLGTKLVVTSEAGEYFTLTLAGAEISNNLLRDVKTKKEIGSIGATGFAMDKSTQVQVIAKIGAQKVMTLTGFYFKAMEKVEFEATLKNSQF